ncbi:hypothetical protein [Bradyrhizobium sp. SEMIA]|uniref:hypothetical protein n=1 Tax=Bradyrhizobium sp. SEMIA TaxID=2597515 RepID=UPI0018A610C5|nr:hypothetical protein [Bradyrhizobium sp. SEMIA]QOG21778.1 hypothetical protein FOM02_35285 [Bradyrhizobium sp. SEMIA]
MRYKVFVVDSNRQVICAAKLDCIDEQAAGRRAEQIYSGHDVELWDGDWLVAMFRGAASNIQAMGQHRQSSLPEVSVSHSQSRLMVVLV